MDITSSDSVPAELTFNQRDGSFNRKSMADIGALGEGEGNRFTFRLNAGSDVEEGEPMLSDSGEETAIG